MTKSKKIPQNQTPPDQRIIDCLNTDIVSQWAMSYVKTVTHDGNVFK